MLQLRALIIRNPSASLRSPPPLSGEAKLAKPPLKGEVALPQAGAEGFHRVNSEL